MHYRRIKKRIGAPGTVALILIGACLVFGVVGCLYVSHASSSPRQTTVPVSPQPVDVTVTGEDARTYLAHLAARGVSLATPADTMRAGVAACQYARDSVSSAAALMRLDTTTGNHLLSVVIYDAATTHLCQEDGS